MCYPCVGSVCECAHFEPDPLRHVHLDKVSLIGSDLPACYAVHWWFPRSPQVAESHSSD